MVPVHRGCHSLMPHQFQGQIHYSLHPPRHKSTSKTLGGNVNFPKDLGGGAVVLVAYVIHPTRNYQLPSALSSLSLHRRTQTRASSLPAPCPDPQNPFVCDLEPSSAQLTARLRTMTAWEEAEQGETTHGFSQSSVGASPLPFYRLFCSEI